jgi:hypothetical protein
LGASFASAIVLPPFGRWIGPFQKP